MAKKWRRRFAPPRGGGYIFSKSSGGGGIFKIFPARGGIPPLPPLFPTPGIVLFYNILDNIFKFFYPDIPFTLLQFSIVVFYKIYHNFLIDKYRYRLCYNNCVNNLTLDKLNCTLNPFDNNDFVLYDSDRKINICPFNTTNDFKIDDNICEKMCPQNCDQTYYSIIFESIIRNNLLINERYSKDLMLKIVNRPIKNYHYQALIKVNLIECVTNIGGLLGLYIGLSIVDLSDIAKTMLTRMITMIEYITSMLCLQILRIRSKKIIKNILTYLRMVKKLPLKHIINAITTPILLMQIFYLVQEYLQYPTQSSTEFPLFETNASSTNRVRISGKEFPDISLCHTINIDHLLFDTSLSDNVRKTLENIDDVKVRHLDYEETKKNIDLFTSTHKYTCENRSLYIRRDYWQVFQMFERLVKNKWTKIILSGELFNMNFIYDFCFNDNKQNEYFAHLCKTMIKYIAVNSYDEFDMLMEPINN